MTVRQEIHAYIDDIPESKLLALRPLLFALADDATAIERGLTDAERSMVAEGMAAYEADPASFIPLNTLT